MRFDFFTLWPWAKEMLGCDPFASVGACGRSPLESADPGLGVAVAYGILVAKPEIKTQLFGDLVVNTD